MKVFKFGGASIADASCIRNIGGIIKTYQNQKILIVVSALGKTTNAIEKVVNAFAQNNLEEATQFFQFLEIEHNALAQDLLPEQEAKICIEQLQNIYAEADWILHDAPVREYDYYYDQLVCLGELMSTTLLQHYFVSIGIKSAWQDVRDVFRTDTTWREASIDMEVTQQNINKIVVPLLDKYDVMITQGFIGCTDENESTTLGREGSDYSAAIFANMLHAESVSIWKDVKGLLSGDPKIFNDVVEIPEISYYEVIEMAYYGAQVIHPKTIKPLHNKNIPLYVKCFLDASISGTAIKTEVEKVSYPPILVLKKKQTLLQVFSKDYSFITDDKLSEIYNTFHNLHTHINIIQNAAISFLACIDDNKTKVEALYKALEKDYKILRNDDVELLTIRHYTPQAIEKYIGNKTVILEQKSRHTIQVVTKNENT
jgi:aspartate kinase